MSDSSAPRASLRVAFPGESLLPLHARLGQVRGGLGSRLPHSSPRPAWGSSPSVGSAAGLEIYVLKFQRAPLKSSELIYTFDLRSVPGITFQVVDYPRFFLLAPS